MKALVTIALLALFALTGEAAISWPGGIPPIETAANRFLDVTINVTGLGSTPATLYLFDFESDEWMYNDITKKLKNPTSAYPDMAPPRHGRKGVLSSVVGRTGIEQPQQHVRRDLHRRRQLHVRPLRTAGARSAETAEGRVARAQTKSQMDHQ